mmetsp:Transcript_263/g.339  ORF Transcript_263/g.339 Transcript_263/m.339 type:complete len:157 (+) Transcript_263:1349-1819(+)
MPSRKLEARFLRSDDGRPSTANLSRSALLLSSRLRLLSLCRPPSRTTLPVFSLAAHPAPFSSSLLVERTGSEGRGVGATADESSSLPVGSPSFMLVKKDSAALGMLLPFCPFFCLSPSSPCFAPPRERQALTFSSFPPYLVWQMSQHNTNLKPRST